MTVIQQVINKAMIFAMTRAGATSSSVLQTTEFRELFDAVSRINAEALSYDVDHAFMKKYSHWAPCSYNEIHQNEQLTASIFTLRAGKEIPLHDHPFMFGIMKVIHGKLRVASYSYLTAGQRTQVTEEWNTKGGGQRIGKLFTPSLNRFEDKHVLPVIQESDRIFTVDDPPAIVTPSENNIHCVQAVDDTAAFFDILSPPYYPPLPNRDCHYFQLLNPKENLLVSAGEQGPSVPASQESSASSSQQVNVIWLVRIPPPRAYWCVSIEYNGPLVKSLTEIELREEIRKAAESK